MTAIPRAIAPDHLRAVLAGCWRDTPVGRRDYAILMLLARLGLRSSEIVSLTLDSIDWEDRSIAVVGKGDQPAVLPLPAEVGEAIAEYLQCGRPVYNDRALFLRANAPIRGLGAGQSRNDRWCGDPPGRHKDAIPGSHQFRHALAIDMLRKGATLTEIGSLLRHRHPKTTGIYAKVDFQALRPLSQPGRKVRNERHSGHAARYLSMRRTLGFKLVSDGTALLSFVDFLEQARAEYISTELALASAQFPPLSNPSQWSAAVGICSWLRKLLRGYRPAHGGAAR